MKGFTRWLAEKLDVNSDLHARIANAELNLSVTQSDLMVAARENGHLTAELNRTKADLVMTQAAIYNAIKGSTEALADLNAYVERCKEADEAMSGARYGLHELAQTKNWQFIPLKGTNGFNGHAIIWQGRTDRDPWFWAESILKHYYGEAPGDPYGA